MVQKYGNFMIHFEVPNYFKENNTETSNLIGNDYYLSKKHSLVF